MQILTGTSGYSYKEWKGNFYPASIKAGEMLSYYAERFKSVEINNTFYRMPTESVLAQWESQVPADFLFVIKASRRITHIKRLRKVGDELSFLFGQLSVLGEKLGNILFQLPPNFKKDLERLSEFLGMVPQSAPVAIEFRNASWFDDEVYDVLRRRNIALVAADTEDTADTRLVDTGDTGYLRLRRESYGESELREWANRIGGQKWRRAFVFFKHEDEGMGPRLAKQFDLLSGEFAGDRS